MLAALKFGNCPQCQGTVEELVEEGYPRRKCVRCGWDDYPGAPGPDPYTNPYTDPDPAAPPKRHRRADSQQWKPEAYQRALKRKLARWRPVIDLLDAGLPVLEIAESVNYKKRYIHSIKVEIRELREAGEA